MVFHGDNGIPSMYGSGLSGAFLPTPPPDDQFPDSFQHRNSISETRPRRLEVDAWMEVWDYAGGASFRAFVVKTGGEKSLFVFFDIEGVLGRDLKKA